MNIILFDGDCNFCHGGVQFIIKRDSRKQFKFASLQSETGKMLSEKYSLPKNIDSMVYIENNRCYLKSTAVFHICRKLDGAWKIPSIFLLIPAPIRNAMYDLVAKNRHKLRKNAQCKIPNKEDLERFI
ncbi:thiol-disulfide oxidoreductase DCC family protein [Lysinibacillus yapensis]|nr:DUF393 domain-containing protein [Lysinibacillus yapensis]